MASFSVSQFRGPTIVIGGLIAAVIIGYYATAKEITGVTLAIFSIVIFLLSFFSVPISLQVLICSMLLSPEVSMLKTGSRDVTIRLDDIALTIMIMSWLLRMAILKDIGFARYNPLNTPIAVYCGIIIVATVLGVYTGDVNELMGFFFVLKFIEYFLLYIIVVNYVRDIETCNRLLTTLLFVLAVVCILGVIQILQGTQVTAPFEGDKPERNTLSGYLVLVGAVAAGILLNTKSGWEKRVLMVTLPVTFLIILFSISRSGWLATGTAFAAMLFYSKQKKVYFLFMLLFLIALPFWAPEIVRDRLSYTFALSAPTDQQVQIGGTFIDPSSSARLFAWTEVLRYILQRPFLGFGVTGFTFVDGQFFRALIETGVIGLTAFVWLLVRVHQTIREASKLDLPPRFHGMIIGFGAGFWGLMAHALTANTFVITRIAEPFWCLVGLTMVLINLKKEKRLPETMELERPVWEGKLIR